MIQAVLCDIEGTTTSIAFAQKVLFPLSYERMESFIHQNPELVRNEMESLKKAHQTNDEVIATLREWIQQDRKEWPLKSIQGKIWKEAFESGQIKGHVYPDVPEQFRKWKKAGISVNIFSSGSIEAQQLIFRFSEAGDLTPYIDHYFDTTTGSKRESDSYRRIAQELRLPSSKVLFLSDVIAELDSAKTAGMQTTLLLRDGTNAPAENQHPIAENFHQIQVSD